ncbi:HutD family protein [Massilia atriviolacea]|uniref:HutD family protein n=1 Tax=Massilia atriviolacea TaxID=2495579 RepID=A0A430HGW4_9BURK|nr:HutD family protein [Massilia atriviolacea]RSZ56759.1 HutD family protein [Massilia atriviolacea]
MTILIPYASLLASPWKNGGGSTTEIAISPPGAGLDTFDWRISLATIAASGPFSVFEGIDRTLALVDGPGVTLDIDGDGRFVLSEDEPVLEFAGEAQVAATVGARPTTDFNVMTRRARCAHQLGRRSLSGMSGFATRADLTVLFLAEGDSLEVSNDEQRFGMVRYDAVLFDGDASWTLEAGQATIFIVDIHFHED